FPTVIVTADRTPTTGAHAAARGRTPTVSRTTIAAAPAAFDTLDSRAATGSGAPAYVSGVHRWNGTAESLKATPATASSTPRSATARTRGGSPGSPSATEMRSKCADPVAITSS